MIFYLVIEQEWLNRGNKVGIHIGQYTTMGGIHWPMPAMASEMADVIFLYFTAQIPESRVQNKPKRSSLILRPVSMPDQSLARLLSEQK